MEKTGLGGTTRRNDLRARLKIAETELAPLLEDVRRDRDRLVAEPVTLRFVWHEPGHPHPGKLWGLGYHGNLDVFWNYAGHFFGRTALPVNEDPTPYDCRIYLVGGDSNVCECFTRHCREAEAIFGRMAGDGTRFNWASFLFETFRDAVDEEGRADVEWRENEEPDRPETWSCIAELRDVFEWTRILLKAFVDGAKLRLRSPNDALLGDEGDPTLVPTAERPSGGQGGIAELRELFESTRVLLKALIDGSELRLRSPYNLPPGDGGNPTPEGELTKSVAAVRGAYEWAISKIPGADEMTISELFKAIQSHPEMKSEYLGRLPNNPDTFGTYLRRAGIQRYNTSGSRIRRPSRHPRT